MKIGIMTHWWSHGNYGQILQAYALQSFLRKHGHNPFIIKYQALLDVELDYSHPRAFVRTTLRKVRRYRKGLADTIRGVRSPRGFAHLKQTNYSFQGHISPLTV